MAHQVAELECPGCGAAITTSTKKCPYCYRDIVITTFHSITEMTRPELNKQANSYRKALADSPDNQELNLSVAFCYLKLKLYDKALPCFEKAMEDNFDNSEVYFYAAVCLLKGKRPFLMQRTVVDKVLEYLDAAIMIESRGIYYYLQAYAKYDFYELKLLSISPDYSETYQTAVEAGLSESDILNLFELLNTERPECL